MKVKYIGPHDEVEVEGFVVKRNHQIDLPPELAGTPPAPRLAEAMAELHQAVTDHDHPGAVKLRDEITGLDYGTGLLAQDTWEAVAKKDDKKDEVSA